ncbi:SDR family oxidoreductase [Thioalkalicoccus limnaeus]|uniref:SDR family oxidoreductase n=1 Tax=Thioalkalicoccus limnaeus TaxID=120681 RepID=A0ABV4BEZ1_9GAMM
MVTTLVFGATGYIGSNLVPYLSTRGVKVRAAARNSEVLAGRGWDGVELVTADALKSETLPAALEGVEIAYYLVHSMAAGRSFGQLDLEAADHFARAAAAAGVARIVYLGGLVPPDADSEHLVSRRDTGEHLRQGPVPVTEIRAGIIVGPGSAAFEVMRDLVSYLPLMITPRWVKSKAPPIALDNLLEYLYRLPQHPATAGGIYDVGGPEVLCYGDMMRELARILGKPLVIIPVPLLTPGLSAKWLRLVTSVPTNIARALIEGLAHDIVADDRAARELVPQALLGFRAAVEATLAAERANAVASRWTEGALMFRDYRPDYGFYAKRASGSATAEAPVAAVWDQVARIGGHRGYYYLNGLWRAREVVDWLIGGPGLRHGRRHESELRIGDMIDSWRVVAIEPERRLTLRFGMRAPGAGVLEFALQPLPDGRTQIETTAYWHPAGVWGLLYWYAMSPLHRLVLGGLPRRIAELAEASPAGRAANA